MAKITSLFMKGTKGTLQGLTFVKSKRYGDHVRSKRGTLKPAAINDALELSKDRLLQANQLARPIFNAVRNEHKDGSLWSRILSLFRKQLKEEKPPGVQCLINLECSIAHSLERLLGRSQYTITVKKVKSKLGITVKLRDQPEWKKVKYIDGYRLDVVVVFPDFVAGHVHKETACGAITSLKSKPGASYFEAIVPDGATEYVLFMKIIGCSQGKPEGLPHVNGMRVVSVGVIW